MTNTKREIKFRAWDGKQMYYSPMLGYNEFVDINEQIKCAMTNGLILMQFTGLLDKNGKECFEGDVVAIEGRETIGEVYWDYGSWQLKRKELTGGMLSAFEKEQIEVIGNIYETPNLLK